MSTHRLLVSDARTGTTARITASGELDIATAPKLLIAVDRILGDQTEIAVLDLSAITFVDSSGLHALLDACGDYPDQLRIVPSAACHRLIDLVGLAGRLPLVWESDQLPGSRADRSSEPGARRCA